MLSVHFWFCLRFQALPLLLAALLRAHTAKAHAQATAIAQSAWFAQMAFATSHYQFAPTCPPHGKIRSFRQMQARLGFLLTVQP
jgi:hypothetical protein